MWDPIAFPTHFRYDRSREKAFTTHLTNMNENIKLEDNRYKNCKYCEVLFKKTRSWKLFCSASCRKKYWDENNPRGKLIVN